MIKYTYVSLSVAKWKSAGDATMEKMFDEDVLPPDRERLTGTENAIFALDEENGRAGEIAGMLVFFRPEQDPDLLWLDLVYVAPDYRRQGIASVMIHHVAEFASAVGTERLELGTALNNAPMIALAQRAGFADTSVYFKRVLAVAGGA